MLFTGYHIVATSFLKTREELINEKVTYLQEIYEFTRKIITLFDFAGNHPFHFAKNDPIFRDWRRSLTLLRRTTASKECTPYPPS